MIFTSRIYKSGSRINRTAIFRDDGAVLGKPKNLFRTNIALFAFAITFLALVVTQNAYSNININIQNWKTKKGVPVYFVRSTQLPIVDLHVVFDAGSSRDGEQYGIAAMVNAMLSQGTKTFNVEKIAEQFDMVGAIYSSNVTRDLSHVGLRSLVKPDYLNKALIVFREMLSSATFPKKAFQRTQNQALIALKGQEESPESIGVKAFLKALYGGQPYGHLSLGTTKTVHKLTPEALRGFYNKYYVSGNAKIFIVGDLTLKRAKIIAERVSSSLLFGKQASALPEVSEHAQKMLKHIVFPSEQTHIFMGQIGIARDDPDYFPLIVGNSILGGSAFTSRLFKQVRIKDGLAYSVVSYFSPSMLKGPFVIYLQTRNQKASEAAKTSNDILDQFMKEGPKENELVLAKQHITRGFALRLASNRAILNNIINIGFYDLPLDYLEKYNDNINAVTLEQIKNAFQKHLYPKKTVTIMVGKVEKKV